VALVSKIEKITGLFCKRALQKRRYSAKETYNLIDPANGSHPIWADKSTRKSEDLGMSHVTHTKITFHLLWAVRARERVRA